MPNPMPELDDAIAFFFSDPGDPPERHLQEGAGDEASALYLLRREIIDTAGYDPDVDDEEAVVDGGVKKRLFATMILCFTVIDLLAKFATGKKMGPAFKEFVGSPNGGGMTALNADLLWAVRNALVHQFNVPDEDNAAMKALGLKKFSFDQRREFDVGGIQGQSVVVQDGEEVTVYIDGLVKFTFATVRKYEDTLFGSDSGQVRQRFKDAYPVYGVIGMTL